MFAPLCRYRVSHFSSVDRPIDVRGEPGICHVPPTIPLMIRSRSPQDKCRSINGEITPKRNSAIRSVCSLSMVYPPCTEITAHEATE